MCGGGPEVDDTPQKMQMDAAAEARAREEARQARIEQGRSFLDALFRGGTYSDQGTPTAVDVSQLPDPAPAPNPPTNVTPDQTPSQPVNVGNLPESQQNNPSFYTPGSTPVPAQPAPAASNTGAPGTQEWEVRYEGDPTPEQTFAGYQPYLDDRRQTLQSFYQPQLDDQYDNAQDQLKYGLARAGVSASSEAAEGYGDLTNKFDIRQSEMLSKIDQDIYDTRSRFEATRGALEDMLLETGDAARVSNEATTRIDQLYSEQPQVNPLGDVFINAISTYGQYGAGKNQGRVAGIYDQPSVTTRAGNSSGSGTFIS